MKNPLWENCWPKTRVTNPKRSKTNSSSHIWQLARPNIAKVGEERSKGEEAASEWARGDRQTNFGILNFWMNLLHNVLGLLFDDFLHVLPALNPR